MRICFLSRRYFPAVSGMSVYAHNFVQALRDFGHDVVMISQYRDDAAGKRIYGGGPPPPMEGLTIEGARSFGEERAPEGEPADFESDYRTLVEMALRHHTEAPFDVVHAQYAYPTGLAALEVSRRLGIPSVVSIQGGDGHWVGGCCRTHADAMDAVLNHAGAVLIGCESFRDEVVENHAVSPDRFTIIPGAVDTTRFHPADRPENAPPVMLYHGRADQRKGLFDTIDAWAALRDDGRPIRAIVSGIGPDLDEAVARVEAAGLSEVVRFTGAAGYDIAPEVYREADIFVSPTYAEGFSNTVLEAMASGLPIVSCHAVGVIDCLTDGENGLLVPCGDVDALSAEIGRLLDSGDLRGALRQQALDDVRRLYTWPVVAGQILGEYERLVGTVPSAAWTSVYDPSRTVEDADLTCRFRADPHLL